MQIINDIISFIKTLSLADVIFFFAVVALMLLIVTLIHFILENKENEIIEESEENTIENNFEEKKNEIVTIKKDDNKNSVKNKISDEDIMKEANDLLEIAAALEQAEPNNVNLNRYEEEQEEKAIISYDELIKHKNDFGINYSEEENIDEELTIKKVDLDNLINKEVTEPQHISVTVISYDKEEAFLQALKTLQQTLN